MATLRRLIENLITIVEDDSRPESDPSLNLISTLDRLMAAVHDVDFGDDENEYPYPPKQDYQRIRQMATERFPSFGMYNLLAEFPKNGVESSPAVGDSLDDIVDIVIDMKDVLWRLDNTSLNDALFHFQLGYRSHWGQHARTLQLYLHDKYW